MIKTIVFLTKVLVAAITSLLFASCMVNNGKQGNGNVRTETRTITQDFTKIDASNAIDVTIETETANAVTVEAESNLLPLITTSVENGTLHISTKGNFSSNFPVKVMVKMPKIEDIKAGSSATVNSANNIIADKLTLTAESSSILDIETESDDLSMDASSGSNIKIHGKALKVSAQAASGGLIEAGGLMANDITTDASSGGNITVSPIVSLDAKASSGGVVHYTREPRTKSVAESSGGDVTN